MAAIFAGSTVPFPILLTLRATGAPVDPDAPMVATVTRPGVAPVVYTYGADAAFTRSAVGVYQLAVPTAARVAAMYTIDVAAVVGGLALTAQSQFQTAATAA